jgi:predicted DsbA family dithiol-disulfide isomerase
MNDTAQTGPVIDVDIVSDVMCPWCIVGYRQLEQALAQTGMGARVRWHPFELNPNMPAEGQNLTEHIQEKYGSTAEQSAQNRAQMQSLGTQLGIDFQFSPNSRIVNTFAAHQGLDFALSIGKQHPLKMALFEAHFTQGRDVSKQDVLLEVAAEVGLNVEDAQKVLSDGALAQNVREKQQFWTERGISGVPSMIFNSKYLVTGAQGADNYTQLLNRTAQEMQGEPV